jgi:hypothetical protein
VNLRKEGITWTPAVIIYGLLKFPSHGCGLGAGHYQVLETGEGSLCLGCTRKGSYSRRPLVPLDYINDEAEKEEYANSPGEE